MSESRLRIVIADDEPVARLRLRTLCGMLQDVDVVGEAGSGSAALAQIETLEPDLVLLDIAMPELDGIGVASALNTMKSPPSIVFCTAYDGHALAAYDLSAVDYLLKPVGSDRLHRALDTVRRLRKGSQTLSETPAKAPLDHVWVPRRDAMMRIDISDLLRIDAEGDYVRLTTGRGNYLMHETLSRLQDRLDGGLFVRLRRSVVARVAIIKRVRNIGLGVWEAELSVGEPVRVGPTYWKSLKLKLRNGVLDQA